MNAAVEAGRFDEALAKLKSLDEKIEKCVPCVMKMAEVLVKMKDEAAAEAAFLKGVEYDPANPEPYRQLANLYNDQRKFDEATKMSAKANELTGASGGGGDADLAAEPGHHLLERRQESRSARPSSPRP